MKPTVRWQKITDGFFRLWVETGSGYPILWYWQEELNVPAERSVLCLLKHHTPPPTIEEFSRAF